jgi:hypothetical protein
LVAPPPELASSTPHFLSHRSQFVACDHPAVRRCGTYAVNDTSHEWRPQSPRVLSTATRRLTEGRWDKSHTFLICAVYLSSRLTCPLY